MWVQPDITSRVRLEEDGRDGWYGSAAYTTARIVSVRLLLYSTQCWAVIMERA